VGDEVDVIRELYGDDALVWDAEDSEFRTSIVDGKCFFLRDNACTIHDKPYYPRICRGFPWIDGETGGEYPYDRTICGELASAG
jgi:Fe-S-cluster containining protein